MTHQCHAHGCTTRTKPSLLMCAKHWFMVSKPLRDKIWATYVPGQERTKSPTHAYMEAFWRAIEDVALKEGHVAAAESARFKAERRAKIAAQKQEESAR